MSYFYDSRIRYSETGNTGALTMSALVNYFQDASIFHSESIRLGLAFLEQENKAWILTNWRIIIDRMPQLGEKVRVSTWPTEMSAFYGLRNFAMEDEKGCRIAYADTTWVYMDMEKGRPSRISKEMTEAYGLEERIPMEKCSRKLEIPENSVSREPFVVPSYFIDTNEHMNNARYVEVAESYLPRDFEIREMRVEYRSSAKLGDVICPRITCEENRITVCLNQETGKPFAVVVFYGKQ